MSVERDRLSFRIDPAHIAVRPAVDHGQAAVGGVAEDHDRIAGHVQLGDRAADGDGADFGLGLRDDHADRRGAVGGIGVAEGFVLDLVRVSQDDAASNLAGRVLGLFGREALWTDMVILEAALVTADPLLKLVERVGEGAVGVSAKPGGDYGLPRRKADPTVTLKP